jgi:acetolactate synthase-1/2/3 large subunit
MRRLLSSFYNISVPRANVSKYFNLTGGEIIKKKMEEFNIDYIPHYAGGAALPLSDAFFGSEKPKLIDTCTEQEAGFIAMGYAKTSLNRPGCVITTSGPGLTNLITPIVDSACDHVPLIAISGQVSTSAIGKDAFQECNSIALVSPYTKFAHQVRNVNELPSILDFAYRCSMHGKKGVSFLDIPKDIAMSRLTEEKQFVCPIRLEEFSYDDIEEKMKNLATLINRSKCPILYIGQGAKECFESIRELAKKSNIPVCTTLHGMGIFDETDELSLKMVGQHGSIFANMAIQKSDLIICVGARFDDRTVGNEKKYGLTAKTAFDEGRGGIVHFDISSEQIGKNVKSHYNYIGDCGKYMEVLLPYINEQSRDNWKKYILMLKQQYPYNYAPADTDSLTIEDILIILDREIKDKEYYLSTGVGNHQMFSSMYLTWKTPNRILTSGSQGVMGSGLGYLIGSYFAKLKEKSPMPLFICINGDASFNMEMSNLQTLAKYNIPIKLFIMNDNRAQMVYVWQELFFNGRIIGTVSHNPNYEKMAESWNIPSFRCETREDVSRLMEKLYEPTPLLINCIVKPSLCLPLVKPGSALDELLMYKKGIYENGILNAELDKSEVPN